jgi:hypothetical protein
MICRAEVNAILAFIGASKPSQLTANVIAPAKVTPARKRHTFSQPLGVKSNPKQ